MRVEKLALIFNCSGSNLPLYSVEEPKSQEQIRFRGEKKLSHLMLRKERKSHQVIRLSVGWRTGSSLLMVYSMPR